MGVTTQTIKLPTDALVVDDYIYPRQHKSQVSIDAYKSAMEAGARFPPIKIQAVTAYKAERDPVWIVIDGVHRLEAYRKLKIEETEVEAESDLVDYENAKLGLHLQAAQWNVSHGDRLKAEDKKRVARDVAEADPTRQWTEQAIADYLGEKQQTIHDWIADIRARQRASRDSQIVRLSRLGWTQGEIAEKTAIGQNRVSQIINNTKFGKIDILLSEGRSMDYIADHYSADLALVWSIRLDGKADVERAEELGIKLRPYDVWRFTNCDPLYGIDYPGRIPGELVVHALVFFTEPNDLVIDTMAGGGTVPDACLVMGRRCYAYDLGPARPDILKHDMTQGWPDRIDKANLIFWDPPYFDKKATEYAEGNIGKLSRNDYTTFLADRFAEAHALVRSGTRLAFLMGDWNDDDGGIFVWDYAYLLKEAGWTLKRHIQAPLSQQQVHPDIVNKFRESRQLARLSRSLIIATK